MNQSVWLGQNQIVLLFKELQIPEGPSAEAPAYRVFFLSPPRQGKSPPRGAVARVGRSGRRWRSPGGLLIGVLDTEGSGSTHLLPFSAQCLRAVTWLRAQSDVGRGHG